MAITQTEFEAILADETKRVVGDLSWREDEDHSPAVEFAAEIGSDPGYPLFVKGWLNRLPASSPTQSSTEPPVAFTRSIWAPITTTRPASASAKGTSMPGPTSPPTSWPMCRPT